MELTDLKTSRDDVLALYGKTEKCLQSDLNILKEWLQKRPHLPMDLLQDEFLEIHLIKNKFSLEKTKKKIEGYCTLKARKQYEYLYEDDICIPSEEPQFYIPLPNLTDDLQRVMVGKIWNPKEWSFKRDFSNALVLREILSRFDYNDGEIILFDLTNFSPMMILKLRAWILSDVVNIALNGYSTRVRQIHLISKLASILFRWTKPFLPSKLASRVAVHDSIEAVAEFIPLKCLPKDYGGELKSIDEFRDDFDRIFTNHREDIIRYRGTKAREELRTEKHRAQL